MNARRAEPPPAARLAKAALEEAGFECHLGRPTFDHYRCRAAGALTGEHRNHVISRSVQLNLTARKGMSAFAYDCALSTHSCRLRQTIKRPQADVHRRIIQENAASTNASNAMSSRISIEKCPKRLGNQIMRVPDGDCRFARANGFPFSSSG